jgi:hypothetical protein
MSRRRPGDPIPGTEGTISGAQQAAALGLQPGSPKGKEAKPQKLTPAQARLKMSDKYVGEGPDIGLEEYTVSAGRDVLDLLGINAADLPLGVEQELGPPQLRPERRPDAPSPPPMPDGGASTEADKLRADYRAHVAKITAMAEAARGDAAKEAAAAEQVRASAALGERLKAKLGGKL